MAYHSYERDIRDKGWHTYGGNIITSIPMYIEPGESNLNCVRKNAYKTPFGNHF